MLEALKFVQGAVAKKDFVPVLTHVHIKDGLIQTYNGSLMLCSPIGIALDCSPQAAKFIKAIQTCKDTIQMSITPTGRLSVKSKGFKTLIDCTSDAFPGIDLEGERIPMPGEGLLPALRLLEPLIAEDASRPWARGILLDGKMATATNNIIVAQLWLDFNFPKRINIPHNAVNELLRIKREPVEMILTDHSATFIYDDERWLRTQLNATQWPDINNLFKTRVDPRADLIPDGFFNALREIAPFVDDINRAYLFDGKVATDESFTTEAIVEGLQGKGCYNLSQLLLLDGLATKFNFDAWPNPAIFYGDKLRGTLSAMRI